MPKLLPYETICKAVNGDTQSIYTVMEHFEGYINRLSMREGTDLYAKEHGLANLRIFSDCGCNGLKTDRPAYQELLEAIRTDQVSDVIVSDLSRLNRDFDNQRCILLEMKTHGVVLHSIREQRAGLISSAFSEYLEQKQKHS